MHASIVSLSDHGARNEHVVGPQYARGGGGEREILLQRLAPAQHGGGHDLHSAFPGLVARGETFDIGLVADEKHALERNAARRRAGAHQAHDAGARRDQAAEPEKIEADDGRARKIAGRLGGEAEHERAGEDEIPPPGKCDGRARPSAGSSTAHIPRASCWRWRTSARRTGRAESSPPGLRRHRRSNDKPRPRQAR